MSEARTKKVIIRMSPSEKEDLKNLSESQGFKHLSDFIRRCCTHVKPWTPEDTAHKKYVIRQVAQASNNINKIAKALHENESIDVLMELSVIRAMLEELL